jgi:V/A-type H+-transporting ATPase subunit I
MAILPMKRVELFGLVKHKQVILKELQRLGLVEPIVKQMEDTEFPEQNKTQLLAVETELAQLNRLLTIFDRFVPQKPNLVEQFAGMKTVMTWEERQNILANENELVSLKEEAFRLDEEYSRKEQSIHQTERELDGVLPWGNLVLPVEAWKGTARLRVVLGSLEAKTSCLIEALSSDNDQPFVLEEINRTDDRGYIVLIIPRSFQFEQDIRAVGFVEGAPDITNGLVSDHIIALKEKLQRQRAELGEEYDHLCQLAKRREMVQVFYDRAYNEKLCVEAELRLIEGKKVFALEGWLEAAQQERVSEVIKGMNLPIHIEFHEPGVDEITPISLENTPLLTPFEYLVNSFSNPNPREIDPTGVVAPFFFILFGIALGDAGYGLTLAVICLVLLKKLTMKPLGEKLAWMFVYCGLGAILSGAMTASYFGIDPPYTPLINPIEEPIKFLVIVLGIGVIQLFAGVICNAAINIKNGRWGDALWNQGFWLLFLIGVLLMLVNTQINLGVYSRFINYYTIVAALLVIIANTRGKKGILAKLLALPGGLFTIYGGVGFFSDVLSYSRIMALGLAGGVMAGIVNMFAGQAWGIPIIGWLLGIAVFLIGHAFNLSLSILGAYVHSSRLQYLEFFGKFYEGGGEAFAPLKWENKYIYLTKEREV